MKSVFRFCHFQGFFPPRYAHPAAPPVMAVYPGIGAPVGDLSDIKQNGTTGQSDEGNVEFVMDGMKVDD